jgi:hypothetical protein
MASASAVECTATVAAELLAGAQHPQGDLAAIGYEDFIEHQRSLKRANGEWRMANAAAVE